MGSPIRLRRFNGADGDLQVGSGCRGVAIVGPKDLDDLPDAEAGSDEARPTPGGFVDEVDGRVIEPTEPFVDEPLGQRRVRLTCLGGTVGQALGGDLALLVEGARRLDEDRADKQRS